MGVGVGGGGEQDALFSIRKQRDWRLQSRSTARGGVFTYGLIVVNDEKY